MAEIQRLLEIMARLRDPESGCPWDLEQDFDTISPFTIEEAYEVDEAIASGDPEALRDELGDLLFQVVFQARIADEKGLFDFPGVIEAIADKLVRRHPHVFAQADAPDSVEAQTASWEAIKAAERRASGTPDTDVFSGIPRHLPALARSAKVAGRLAQLGDGGAARLDPTERKVSLADALAAAGAALAMVSMSKPEEVPREEALERVGAGLRGWVQIARALGVDPEQALRAADDAVIRGVRGG